MQGWEPSAHLHPAFALSAPPSSPLAIDQLMFVPGSCHAGPLLSSGSASAGASKQGAFTCNEDVGCPQETQPVCGQDGEWYQNRCIAGCSNIAVDDTGKACSGGWAQSPGLWQSGSENDTKAALKAAARSCAWPVAAVAAAAARPTQLDSSSRLAVGPASTQLRYQQLLQLKLPKQASTPNQPADRSSPWYAHQAAEPNNSCATQQQQQQQQQQCPWAPPNHRSSHLSQTSQTMLYSSLKPSLLWLNLAAPLHFSLVLQAPPCLLRTKSPARKAPNPTA
jgi:hypothetical protein